MSGKVLRHLKKLISNLHWLTKTLEDSKIFKLSFEPDSKHTIVIEQVK